MQEQLQNFYLQLPQPNQSCCFAIRDFVLNFNHGIVEKYKYKLAYFYYQNKPLCYLWFNKKTKHPYLGFSRAHLFHHPKLELGNRKKIKILAINPNRDLDANALQEILTLALNCY